MKIIGCIIIFLIGIFLMIYVYIALNNNETDVDLINKKFQHKKSEDNTQFIKKHIERNKTIEEYQKVVSERENYINEEKKLKINRIQSDSFEKKYENQKIQRREFVQLVGESLAEIPMGAKVSREVVTEAFMMYKDKLPSIFELKEVVQPLGCEINFVDGYYVKVELGSIDYGKKLADYYMSLN